MSLSTDSEVVHLLLDWPVPVISLPLIKTATTAAASLGRFWEGIPPRSPLG